jgi:chitinase
VNYKKLFFCTLLAFISAQSTAQTKNDIRVLAYFSGSVAQLDSFDVNKITHIIYCFGHLRGNRFHLSRARDTALIEKMVSLKAKNKNLKVLLSLGGWGGCRTCSEVFSTEADRQAFATSVREHMRYFKTDGIDLDWEYPTVVGYPGHRFAPEDKSNFTSLLKTLRSTLDKGNEISFAAGGYTNYLDSAVEWKEVIKYADYINIMSYDLVGGYSPVTGHHTPLYSTPQQRESADNAITWLEKHGIPPQKLVIGGAFYARVWENVPDVNNGLYQPGKFKQSVGFKNFYRQLTPEKGFTYFWDDVAKAPYMYNSKEKLFATFDDRRSITLKTEYAKKKKLYGIMFWQLGDDVRTHGLLHAIDSTRRVVSN